MSAGAASGVGLVMTANGIASLAIGIYLAMEVEVPLLWSLAVVVVAFVFLTGCLLDRRMVWIAIVLGGSINAGIGAFMLAALSENLHPKAPWVAGPLGFLLGVFASIWEYKDAARIARGDD